MNWEKGFAPILIILLIVVVLVAIGGAYYLGTQKNNGAVTTPVVTPLPTAARQINGLQTFTDPQNGYSIQYPGQKLVRLDCKNGESLILALRSPNDNLTDSQKDVEERSGNGCAVEGNFPIKINVTGNSFESPQSGPDYNVAKGQALMVGGQSADSFIITPTANCNGPCVPVWEENVFLKTQTKIYEFELADQDLLADFNQMLASFKFTK